MRMQLQRLYIPLLFTTKKEDKKEDVFKEKKRVYQSSNGPLRNKRPCFKSKKDKNAIDLRFSSYMAVDICCV